MNFKKTLLTIAATTTGLNAGLFYAYQVSVIPAFKTVSNERYIAGMQAINVAIQNPLFALNFIGAAIFLPVTALLYRSRPDSLRFKLLVAASLLYIIGTLGITMGANVALNDQLAQFSLQNATPEQAATARAAFEGPWNNWHTIRTISAIGALLLVIIALLSPATDEVVPEK